MLLTIPHPTNANHNGGMLAFGPDGYLYIGVGDGGSANDPPTTRRTSNVLLGKILRIDVDHADRRGTPYASPPTIRSSVQPGRDEIFAFGLRNPWRFSFDRVDRPAMGRRRRAGRARGSRHADRARRQLRLARLRRLRLHGQRSGTVRPGELSLPDLRLRARRAAAARSPAATSTAARRQSLPGGTYVYGDYCSGEIFAWDGAAQTVLLDTPLNISSFGEDEQGELYVVDLGGYGEQDRRRHMRARTRSHRRARRLR